MVWINEDAADKEKEKEEAGKELSAAGLAQEDTNERGYADRRIAWRYDALTFETTVGECQCWVLGVEC
jgi:hypothetical protein